MVLLNRGTENYYLLLVVMLTACLKTCEGILTKDPRISVDENLTRPEVRTPQGIVRGINMVTHHRRNIFGFKRIPYAQPPVGKLRFKGPLPAGPWNGILDAGRDSTPCLQLQGITTPIGDEDCLYLNIYTPLLPTSKNLTLLPVMVYVVGGGFNRGHINPSRWGPHFLLDQDVVLVVPAYRLGVFGFLSTGDAVSPGNYGLKDLVQALKWNRENIQYFGGDPNQVTLAGGSSGAMGVHLLTLSNSTEGLFHRYITQSGSGLSSDAQRPRRAFANRATQLGEYLGCSTNASIVLVNCLKSFNASHLIISESLVFRVWKDLPEVIWAPTVEPNIEGALITDSAMDLLAAGNVRDLPWLCSVTRDEGIVLGAAFYEKPEMFEELLDKLDAVLPHILGYVISVDNATTYTNALTSYYLNDLTADRSLLLTNFTRLVGDISFNYPFYSTFQQHLDHAQSPIYFASFEYRGVLSHSYMFSGGSTKNYGVAHGDEIIYLFGNEGFFYGPPSSEMTQSDWRMVDTMVQLWTSFVINGTPIVGPNSPTIWEPYSSQKAYMRIGSDSDLSIEVKHDFFGDHSSFWEELTAATLWEF